MAPRRTLLLVAATLAGLSGRPGMAGPSLPRIEVEEISCPARAGAGQAVLDAAGDGTVRLIWIEPAAGENRALRCSPYSPATGRWETAATIAVGAGFPAGPANLPAFCSLPGGRALAAWSALGSSSQTHCLMLSESADRGRNWTAPHLISRPGSDAVAPALAAMPAGGVLAAWLERRESGGGADLRARFLGQDTSPGPGWLLDPQACEQSQPSLAALLDGSSLIAYRGHEPAGDCRPRVMARRDGRWEEPREIDPDPQSGPGGAAAGPQIAADGGRLAAAWCGGTGPAARLFLSSSPDAGGRFLLAVPSGGDGPAARPACVLLHDGTILVAWLGGSGRGEPAVLRIRRLSAALGLGPVVEAAASGPLADSPPRMAVVRDYAGDGGTAEILVALPVGGRNPGIRMIRATVPEGALLAAADDDCRCAPTPAQLAGYPVRGRIAAVAPEAARITLDLDPAPGVMGAGPRVFRASAEALAEARAGRQCLARIERRGGEWRVFDLRLLEDPR